MPELLPDPYDDSPPTYTPIETYQSLADLTAQVTSLEGLKAIVFQVCKRVEAIETRVELLEARVTTLEA
jgi:hypothetical protein